MSARSAVARPAGTVAFFTFISRILGLVREMVIAFSFGAGAAADAFFVAFRIPNLLRRLVAEGALTAAFLPVYVEYLENRTPEDAQRVANVTFTMLAMVLSVLTLGGVLLSPMIIHVFAPGFVDAPDKFQLAVSLNRVLFPYIFFVSLVALCMGVLNAKGHFAVPAASPILLNVFMITGALVLSQWLDPPIFGLAVGVLLGGLCQLLIQIPALAQRGVRIRPCFSFRDEAVKRIGRLFVPAAFGAAVYQLNIFVSQLLASFLPEGSISYLWYANRILEFPLGVFGIALTTAAFPSLSRQSSRNDMEGFGKVLDETLRLITFICVPAMVGLILLREPIVQVLFQHGAFDPVTTVRTADALLYYCIGLWPIAAARILVACFYSLQDTATPVKLSLISFVANVILCLILMGPMGHCGLALANSLSSLLNAGMLLVWFRFKSGTWALQWVKGTGVKVLLASALMGLCVWLGLKLLDEKETAPLLLQCLQLAGLIGLGGISYLFACRIWGVKELQTLAGMLRKRR